MDLKALSFEQQQKAILHQLKESKEFESLSALTQARKKASEASQEIEACKTNAKAAYDTMCAIIATAHGLTAEDEIDSLLQKIMLFFEEASGIPVLLSMMVLFFSSRTDTDKLPVVRLELYRVAIQGALRRRMPDPTEASAASTMLSRVAVANHLVQKREFDSNHVKRSLEGLPGATELWKKLLTDPAGVPLVKILELSADEDSVSTFQFTHLSFQEGYFAEAVLRGDDLPTLWERGALRVLDDRWFLNTFVIGSQVIWIRVEFSRNAHFYSFARAQRSSATLIDVGREWARLLPPSCRAASKACRLPISSARRSWLSSGSLCAASRRCTRSECPGQLSGRLVQRRLRICYELPTS